MKFDVAIDFHGLTKSGYVARASGAPKRIGYGDHDARELNGWFTNVKVTPPAGAVHVIDRNNALLRPLGITDVPAHFHFSVTDADKKVVHDFLNAHDLKRFALINPAGSWQTKYYPPEAYGQVAKGLKENAGLPTVVTWFGEAEKKEADQLVAASDGTAVAAPSTGLGALAHLLSLAAVYIGLETGPTHMAVGVGTPSVCLVGPSDPVRNGPYGPGHAVVELGPEKLSCARCWKRKNCPNDLRCMTDLTPDMILEAAGRILAPQQGVAL